MPVLKKFFLIICIISCSCAAFGQADTANKAESTRIQTTAQPLEKSEPVKKIATDRALTDYDNFVLHKDSLQKSKKLPDSLLTDSAVKIAEPAVAKAVYDTSSYKKYETGSFLPLNKTAIFMLLDYHQQSSKDDLFYLMAGIVFILAFIRVTFSKYFRNLFLLFFQTSLRQKQTRDQLLQDNLASLLTNFLFVISAGLYITLLIRYKNWTDVPFWWLAAGSAIVLLLVYLIKYLFLLFTGWVFTTKEAAGSYVFVVFLVNKVLGILLVPFLLILSFGSPELVQVAVTVSIGMILLLFAYRYWVSFTAIRNKLKVNALHFFLYLCAVELLPLVLIYKVLINYFTGNF